MLLPEYQTTYVDFLPPSAGARVRLDFASTFSRFTIWQAVIFYQSLGYYANLGSFVDSRISFKEEGLENLVIPFGASAQITDAVFENVGSAGILLPGTVPTLWGNRKFFPNIMYAGSSLVQGRSSYYSFFPYHSYRKPDDQTSMALGMNDTMNLLAGVVANLGQTAVGTQLVVSPQYYNVTANRIEISVAPWKFYTSTNPPDQAPVDFYMFGVFLIRGEG